MGQLSRMFRRGRSKIHEILDETCPAIHKVLKADYLTVSPNISVICNECIVL